MSGNAAVCPGCSKPLPASVVNGPAQAVVRCDGCQTLLLWSNGRVMRSAKSATGTMMGMAAVTPAATSTLKPASAPAPQPATTTAARPTEASVVAPLPELRPEADAAAPAKAPSPAVRTATQPLVARVAAKAPSVTGLTDNVPTKVATPHGATAAAKQPAPAATKEPAPAATKEPAPAAMKGASSGPVKLPPPAAPAPRKEPATAAKPAAPAAAKPAPSPVARPAAAPAAKPTPSPAAKPATAPSAKPAPKEDKPHVVAAVAQVPEMGSGGNLVDPSAWFKGGDVSDVVPPEKLPTLPPIIESTRLERRDSTGAAPLPPPPVLPPLDAEPFEIEAPITDATPPSGTPTMEEDSPPVKAKEPPAPAPVKAKEPSAPVPAKAKEPSAPIPVRPKEPSSPAPVKAKEPSPPIAVKAKEPSHKIATAATEPPRADTGRAIDVPSKPEPAPSPPPRATPQAAAIDLLPPSEPTPAMPSLTATEGPPPSLLPATPTAPPADHPVTSETALPPLESTAALPDLVVPEAAVLTSRVAKPIPRRVLVIASGAAGVLLLALVAVGLSHGGKKAPGAVATVTPPTAPAPAATPPPAVAPAPTPAAAATGEPTNAEPTPTEPAATEPATPAPPRPHKTLGGKKVVLEYDPKPTSPAPPPPQAPTPMGEDPATVARAREAYHKGNVKLFAGDTASAIVSYRESIKIYPGYVAGYRGLGLAFEQAGRKDDALTAFRTYVRTVPNATDTPIIRRRIEHLEGSGN